MVTRSKSERTPLYLSFICGVSYVGAMLASNASLKWVNYPTQVLGKSCKPIPVMILGVLLAGKWTDITCMSVCNNITCVPVCTNIKCVFVCTNIKCVFVCTYESTEVRKLAKVQLWPKPKLEPKFNQIYKYINQIFQSTENYTNYEIN